MPVAIPDAVGCFACSGDAWAGAVGALGVIEVATVEVAEGEVREVEILRVPGGVFCGVAREGLAEEGEFEAETVTVRRLEIAGVIPPLGLEIRVIEMVAGEGIAVAGEG